MKQLQSLQRDRCLQVALIFILLFLNCSNTCLSLSMEAWVPDSALRTSFMRMKILFIEYKKFHSVYPKTDKNSTWSFKIARFVYQVKNDKIEISNKSKKKVSDARLIKVLYSMKRLGSKFNMGLYFVLIEGKLLKLENLNDLWGTEIKLKFFESKEQEFGFYSFGENKKFDNFGKDDILSWGSNRERYLKYYPIPLMSQIRRKRYSRTIFDSCFLISFFILIAYVIFKVWKNKNDETKVILIKKINVISSTLLILNILFFY